MVGSVSSTPYSYLNQLLGTTATTTAATASTSNTGGSAAASTSSASGSSTASSLVSSLLSGAGSSGSYSSEVLSLLQENGSGSFDPITSLLGGTSTNDGLTSIYSNLFASSLAATLQQAQTSGTADKTATASTTTTATDPIDSLINSYTQASISYNATNQQNSQSVIDANSYGANGTSLVS